MKDFGIKAIKIFFAVFAVVINFYMAFFEQNPSSINIVSNYLLLVNISSIAYITTSFKLGCIMPLICFKVFPLKTSSILRYRLGELVFDKLWFTIFLITPIVLLFNNHLSPIHTIVIIILSYVQLFISNIIILGLWDRYYLLDEDISNRIFLLVPAAAGLNSFIQGTSFQFINPFGGVAAFLYQLVPIFGFAIILIAASVIVIIFQILYLKFTEYVL